MNKNTVMTRDRYLVLSLILDGTPWYIAEEAVASTALEHPEWDMNEEKTWSQWNA
jgi:hypothetical protein